jgi:hypothetical protein
VGVLREGVERLDLVDVFPQMQVKMEIRYELRTGANSKTAQPELRQDFQAQL